MHRIKYHLTVLATAFAFHAHAAFTVTASRTELIFRFDSPDRSRTVVELAPYQPISEAVKESPLPVDATSRTVAVPRFDGVRDRIYSGFVAVHAQVPQEPERFVEIKEDISKYDAPYPHTRSKKGLQVQMIDDAVALGVQHAAFNVDMGGCVAVHPAADDLPWTMDGRTFWFHHGYIHAIDHGVKELSGTGATVTLILLNYWHPGSETDPILRHPQFNTNCPGHISEFNTSTAEGLAWFKAWVEFLSDRYAEPGYPHGRAENFIIGNEVDAHWDWANMGYVPMDEFARDYQRAVRAATMAVAKTSSSDRVFISLEHDWNRRFAEANALQGFGSKPFLDYFNKLAKEGGDFAWNLAFHPYPEDLFKCRTWEDKSAIRSEYSPRITFKNIEILAGYFKKKAMLYHDKPRHIILSEQGFHAKPTKQGDLDQAAAYCYAWRKIVNLDGIDAFILHRHVDNGGEGGLNLGLWTRQPDSVATPFKKRPMYYVFKAADTPEWEPAFRFALPIIGIKSWAELDSTK